MKKYALILAVALCIGITWFFWQKDACNTYGQLLNCPQATWKGIDAEIPSGYSYTLDEERMMIVNSDNIKGPFLALHKTRINDIDGLEEKFRATNPEIISSSTEKTKIGGHNATQVSLTFEGGQIKVYIGTPKKTFLATYIGPTSEYPVFFEILKKIKFTDSYTLAD